MPDALAVIRSFMIEADAELARAILEANGIGAYLLRDNAGGMLPSLQIISEIRLAVRAEDAEEARAVLEAGDG
ncbi:MAG TPA: DUF2007 domain-containing protein [Gemmatimonadales bacterium]|nr:DUF2007 domain-containing protein [Gemmatimonadales bacterium]